MMISLKRNRSHPSERSDIPGRSGYIQSFLDLRKDWTEAVMFGLKSSNFYRSYQDEITSGSSILYIVEGYGKLGSGQNIEFQVANGSLPSQNCSGRMEEIHGRFIDIHQDFDSAQFTDLVWKEWNDQISVEIRSVGIRNFKDGNLKEFFTPLNYTTGTSPFTKSLACQWWSKRGHG